MLVTNNGRDDHFDILSYIKNETKTILIFVTSPFDTLQENVYLFINSTMGLLPW